MFYLFSISTYSENLIDLTLMVQKLSNFEGPVLVNPQRGTPDFKYTPVLLDIYNLSKLELSLFCDLKVNSGKRKR